ncbi:MAG: bifunctional glutamate N-acetyltransferase/amino-acid acetyltransferase ArgJ [Candidatus Omnitrophica bacterium]|nr:bifunctional glutamate N-acetyltransferase/amino-acid acetyltransferase ArgJ [Candidatus Omnitrophota bacterium]
MKIYNKAVLPVGFLANGISAGIKRASRLDLALFYSDIPLKVSAKFTTNTLPSASVLIDKQHLRQSDYFKALIVNSGNANCFTGKQGIEDANKIIKELAKLLKTKKEAVLISSTGIIGKRLPVAKIVKTLPRLIKGLSKERVNLAKKAILTTDTFPKEITAKFRLKGKTITLCGIAKGAGMIAPNLATMLCFIFTDANITQRALNKALDIAVDNSFNCITVDGCMSTNDTLILLANGEAKNELIDIEKNFSPFLKALNTISVYLAKLIIRDAEGATKFIEIKVKEARTLKEARQVALSIANSNLFKTAMYGENPNLGRIIASIGACGIKVWEDNLKIKVSSLRKRDISVEVSLKRGDTSYTIYTADLTPEYIKINARYN